MNSPIQFGWQLDIKDKVIDPILAPVIKVPNGAKRLPEADQQ
jgi:hypothetical protein